MSEPRFWLNSTYDGPNGRTRVEVLHDRANAGKALAMFRDYNEAATVARLLNDNPIPQAGIGAGRWTKD